MKPFSNKPEVIILSIIFFAVRLVYARYVEAFDSYSSQEGVCGERTGRVINGDEATAGEFPWITSIQTTNGQHFCAGFIVNSRFVISAAHCFHKMHNGNVKYQESGTINLESFKVAVGHVHLTDPSKRIIDVRNLIMHPEFDPRGFDNDIAILELQNDTRCAKKFSPICLPSVQNEDASGPVTVAGWGYRQCNSYSISNELHKITVPLWRDQDCKKSYEEAGYGVITRQNFFCAGSEGKDTWKGDSGGPLMLRSAKNRFTAIGIVSAGRFGCHENVPTIYTKLSSYLSWIRSQIGNKD